ncbi:MAG: hypothetical protein AAGJ31_04645 [Verrucomicrobiota bacterium]
MMIAVAPFPDSEVRNPSKVGKITQAFWALEELHVANESLERHLDVFVASIDRNEERQLALLQGLDMTVKTLDEQLGCLLDDEGVLIRWTEMVDFLEAGIESLAHHSEEMESAFEASPFTLFLEEVTERYEKAYAKAAPLAGVVDGGTAGG